MYKNNSINSRLPPKSHFILSQKMCLKQDHRHKTVIIFLTSMPPQKVWQIVYVTLEKAAHTSKPWVMRTARGISQKKAVHQFPTISTFSRVQKRAVSMTQNEAGSNLWQRPRRGQRSSPTKGQLFADARAPFQSIGRASTHKYSHEKTSFLPEPQKRRGSQGSALTTRVSLAHTSRSLRGLCSKVSLVADAPYVIC